MKSEDKKIKTPEDQVTEAAQASKETAGEAQDLPETIEITQHEFLQIKSKIERLQADYNSTVELAKRVQADFDNYRKRNAALYSQSVDEGIRKIIKSLLPVLDNFDRALDNAAEADKDWVEGVKLVYRQLIDVLVQEGLSEIQSEGMFDPMIHDAVLQEESQTAESGSILAVFQKGYKVKDQVIRYSKVKVSK